MVRLCRKLDLFPANINLFKVEAQEEGAKYVQS